MRGSQSCVAANTVNINGLRITWRLRNESIVLKINARLTIWNYVIDLYRFVVYFTK